MPTLFTEFLSFPLLKEILLVTNVVLFVVIVSLFATLVVHKLAVEHWAQRLNELKERYLTDLSRACYDADLPVKRPNSRLEFEACGGAVTELLVIVDGDMATRMRSLALHLGIDHHYKKQLRSRSWVKRFAALERLGFLRCAELKPLFVDAITGENDLRIVAKALWALSLIATAKDLPLLNHRLQDALFMSGKFNQHLYANVIRAFRERGEEDAFLRLLGELIHDPALPVLLKRDILQACGEEQLLGAQETILDAYQRFADVPEMRIACIRALERLAVPFLTGLIADCLKDPDWRLRAAAAKEAYFCANGIVEPVRGALYDENYHVRINAAESLIRLGEQGQQALVAETRSADRFVRDVSQYVLKRMIYAA
jgi:hypothetical protein